MPVTLMKGQKLSLNKGDPGLKNIVVGIGGVNLIKGGTALDIDVSAFLLTAAGKVSEPKDFVFYGNLTHPSGAVVHITNNSNRKDSDREKIRIDLSLIPPAAVRIAFTATIYDADIRKQTFSQVGSAYIRIYNEQTNEEIVRYNLAENFTFETAVVFGEIYKNNGEWKFNAMGSGHTGGLAALCGNYGVEVG